MEPFQRITPSGPILRYLALASLLFVVAGILLARYLVGPYGFAFADIGSDSFFQFYPMQTEFVRMIREGGTLGWSHRVGLGAYMGPAMDPSMLLAVLWPIDRQLDARAWVYLAKLLASGLLFFAYLREIRLPDRIAVVGALGYMLSGYLVINGQWDPHGTEAPLFALLLFGIERCARTGRGWFLVAAGVMVGLHNLFSLYTCSVFCAIYVLARQAILGAGRPADLGSFVKSSLRLAGFYCVGLLLAAPVLLPNLAMLFDSPRVGGAASLHSYLVTTALTPNDHRTLHSMVAGLFDKSILGIGDQYLGWGNYFEGPGFYVGLLPLLLVTQLFGRGSSPAEKRLAWFIVATLAFYFVFPFLRFATYGFGHMAFRLSTLWMSLLVLVGGVVAMRRIGRAELSLSILVVTAIVLATLLAWLQYSDIAIASTSRIAMLMLLLVVYGGLAIAFDRARLADAAPLALGGVLLLELFVTAYGNINERKAVGKDGASVLGSYQDDTPQAIDWLRENRTDFALTRLEKNYDSVFLCDSLVQNYRGVASYYFHGSALTAVHDGFGMRRPVPAISYIGHADVPGLMSVFGVKYLLSRGGPAPPGWRLAHRVADIDIFEDPAAEGIAQFRSRMVVDVQAMQSSPEQRTLIAHDSVIVDSRVAALVSLPAPSTAEDGEAASPMGGRARLLKLEQDRVVAAVDATIPGLVVFAVPYDRGWRAQVDGESVRALPVNFGFIGVPVEAGVHAVKLRYRPPYRIAGWLACVGASVMLVVSAYLRFRRRRPDRGTAATSR